MSKHLTPEELDAYVEFMRPRLPSDWTHREHDIRNETLEEIASAVYAMPLVGASESLATWIRMQKSGPGGKV